MERANDSSRDTEAALLASAAEIFAAKGYHEATIAEICEAAGANVAAVNYYFRSKENLYVAAWRQGYERVAAAYPDDAGVPADAPAPQRLGGRVLALMSRLRDPANHNFEILHKELANPTGLLDEGIRECLTPVHEKMAGIVGELLGPAASKMQLHLCTRSIMAQCLHLLMPERRRRSFPPTLPHSHLMSLTLSTAELSDHVTRFSLAGIRQMRSEIDNGTADMMESPLD